VVELLSRRMARALSARCVSRVDGIPIFVHSPEQRAVAEQTIAEVNAQKIWDDPIVTQVVDAPPFYAAEDYHQDYYAKNPNQGYCRVVIAPKVAKFRSQQLARLQR